MSQSSDSGELWQCMNPACPNTIPIPLTFGKTFTSCPFCKTDLVGGEDPEVKVDRNFKGRALHAQPRHEEATQMEEEQASSDLDLTDPTSCQPLEPVNEMDPAGLTGSPPPDQEPSNPGVTSKGAIGGTSGNTSIQAVGLESPESKEDKEATQSTTPPPSVPDFVKDRPNDDSSFSQNEETNLSPVVPEVIVKEAHEDLKQATSDLNLSDPSSSQQLSDPVQKNTVGSTLPEPPNSVCSVATIVGTQAMSEGDKSPVVPNDGSDLPTPPKQDSSSVEGAAVADSDRNNNKVPQKQDQSHPATSFEDHKSQEQHPEGTSNTLQRDKLSDTGQSGTPVEVVTSMKVGVGPPCQFCEKNLLESTATICENCHHKQRKQLPSLENSSASESSEVESPIPSQRFKYPVAFGPNTGTNPPSEVSAQTGATSSVKATTPNETCEPDPVKGPSGITIADFIQMNRGKRRSSISFPGEDSSIGDDKPTADFSQRHQRKRSSSVSLSREDVTVKQFKSDNGNGAAISKSLRRDSKESFPQSGSVAHTSTTGVPEDVEYEVYRKPPLPEEGNKNRKKSKKDKPKNPLPTKPSNTNLHGNNPTTERSLPGLNTPKSVEVVFHVIIPKPFWEWDESSQVFLRFGIYELGYWGEDIGTFKRRDISKSLCEMVCRLKMDPGILKSCIPYKYVVFTPKTRKVRDACYEYLHVSVGQHGQSGKPVNRALFLNPDQQKRAIIKGSYHQFDIMAFPHASGQASSTLEVVKEAAAAGWNAFRSFVTGKKEEKSSKVNLQNPSNLEMRQTSLLVYLESYREILSSCGFGETMPPDRYVEEVQHIFNSVSQFPVTTDPGPQAASHPYLKHVYSMKKSFIEWLDPVIDKLQTQPTKKQLLGAACITWCLLRLDVSFDMIEVKEDLAPVLLKFLCVQESTSDKEWLEYNFLNHFLLNKVHREEVAKAVCKLSCSSSARRRGDLDWIFGIPLNTFLSGMSDPYYDNICTKSDKSLTENWNYLDKTFKLREVRNASGKFLDCYADLQTLFELDPLALQAFVYVCPNVDLCDLFARIPPNVCTAWLSFLMTNLGYKVYTRDDSSQWRAWIDACKQSIFNCKLSWVFESPSNSALLDSAMWLFKRCTLFVRNSSEHCVDVITAAASLLLTTLQYLQGEKSHIYTETFSEVLSLIRDWISDSRVVGGKMFGRERWQGFSYYPFKMGDSEIKIWKSFLCVECTDSEVCEEWQKVIHNLLTERVNNVPDSAIVQLLRFVERNSDGNEVLTNAVMNAAVRAADSILSGTSENQVESITEITKENSKFLGQVLGTILEKRYPQLKKSNSEHDWITLDVLLDWAVWPNYLKIVMQGNESLLREGLPPECQIACICAMSKFRDVCQKLKEGDISIADLHKIHTSKTLVERLCKAVEDKDLTYLSVSASLSRRFKELQFFWSRHQAYQRICQWIPNPSLVKGILPLKEELDGDFSNSRICDLCQIKNGVPELQCFHSAQPLEPFIDHFATMMDKSSILFLLPLNRKLKKTLSTYTDLSIADIYLVIWQPVFEHCQNLLESLVDQSMKLSFVDSHLKDHSERLSNVVFNLAVGVSRCLGESPELIPLRNALQKIKQYWRLCEYRDGAQVFLQLRDVLNLKGDFGVVEKLSVQLTESMKDQALSSIDESLIDTGEFLEDIVQDQQKNECLKKFGECQDVIKWLRGSTTSVNDIQGFVTVALATAAGGEGDLAHDKLSHLRTVGSGFASLIYEVQETDDYIQLKKRCKSLWEALKTNHNLPDLLQSCNSDLEWYKSVKETQGSVETTSYGQMTNILKYGTYRVCFNKNAQAVHDLISVTLSQRHVKLIKTKYSLDELRDLESKLVLICGNKADTRAEVDHYLNLLHSATRIAELYLDLQRAGDVAYSTARLEFRCAVYDVKQEGVEDLQFNESKAKEKVTLLQEYTRKLDAQLASWRKNVDVARGQFYELNYFTTLQLLHLRKELGLLTQSTSASAVKPSVLMLLKSVSPEVTRPVVIASLQAAVCGDTSQHEALSTAEVGQEETIPLARNAVSLSSTVVEDMDIAPAVNRASSPSAARDSLKPEQPTLTFEELSTEQQEVFTSCVSYLGYSRGHILKAFHESSKDANIYDIEEWCEKNEDDSPKEELSTALSSTATDEIEDDLDYDPDVSDSEEVGSSKIPTSESQPGATAEQGVPSSDISPRIKTVVRQTIDETHPDVQELVEAGYDLQASIEAFDQFRDQQAAMVYLDSTEMEVGEGGVFQPGGVVRSISTEEPRDEVSSEVDEMDLSEYCDPNASKHHLELDQLGRVLATISNHVPGAVMVGRPFNTSLLKCGLPNLLVTSPDNVLSTVLALYTENTDLPLPTQEEVLVCNHKTTAEEVSLLWRRAIRDPDFKRVFCLAHAEKLSYQVCDAALRSLSELSQGKSGYRLVIVSSKEDEEKSHIISRLHTYRRPIVPKLVKERCKEYLKSHFIHHLDMEVTGQTVAQAGSKASLVDPENSCVRVVASTRSGMGKSLYIQRRAQELRLNVSKSDVHVIMPIHGPVVSADSLLDFFKQHMDRDVCTIYHLDIAPSVLMDVDCILFSLLILNGLSDSRGNVWKCHPSHLYMVEVTLPENVMTDQSYQTLNLLTLLPTVQCVSPQGTESLPDQAAGRVGMDEMEFRGPTIQRVYQYLRRHAAGQNLDSFSYTINRAEGDVRDCLRVILSKCGIRDPTWAEIHHFTKFLDIQLGACEGSVFCDESLVGDIMSGLKGFVVKFMIRMSQDFSTPSLEGVLARENLEPENHEAEDDDQLVQYQIVERRQWEQNSHPYIFFNDDGMSITFVGFMVTPAGDLIDPGNRTILEPAIMRPQLYTGLKQNRVNFNEDYRGWSKEQMIHRISTVMGIEYVYDPDDTYVLTTDNLIKMLAIQMRFRCDIPVVIMGETGCGKTRLIRYMCDLARQGLTLKNMLILKIHGGIADQDVTKFVEDAEKEAQKNKATDPKMDTVVFFDEANTTDSIGLIKEIMCDRRLKGRPVSKDLKFIAACNPYRKHTEEMITKLETAGLGFYVRETQQKLGKIPLRQLVYRVLDLPPSMRPLVYDFGQLNTGTEYDYTKQIVKDHVQKHPDLCTESPSIIPAISAVLAASQKFMRDQKNECSFVSLRDVERAMIVFEYFYEKMDLFATLMDDKAEEEYNAVHIVDSDDEEDELPPRPPLSASPSNLTRALILSLSVCYHARLQNRENYEKHISHSFSNPLRLPGGAEQFRNEIKWCQEGLLDNMVLGPNIAKNAALRENVFMMAICIELRIPLFLVGKPGSSKSLAKSIINDSMHGQGSRSELLRQFKQVHMFSYQCSQLSTPESVIEVFKLAEKFQAKQDTKQYVSVVVLDEVGLAEDSPSLPLKALHPLLEDGTEGSGKDHQQKVVEREKRVAFIGISNWALDPAKMNRGVMVTRGVPGLEELRLSARGICSTRERDPVREQLHRYFEPLSRAYIEICKKQERQFFGLRDFYSLIKMLYSMCDKSKGHPLSWPQLEHAIRRNFGGLESDELNPFEEFHSAIGYAESNEDFSDVDPEMLSIVNPDCSRLGLIKRSLSTKDTTWHGENRYLLFLTENYAALDILKHYLNVGSEASEEESLEITSQPFILFGSSFPKDKEYTQVCRNINQIKICMETGRTVILLNLENLYESLYDVLNQYYMHYGGVRYVDLGLQTHRVKCRVHNNFKLILIAEKDTVYKKFPTPLINRLEKHFVLTSSVLEEWQHGVLKTFEKWVQDFSRTSDIRGNTFREAHAFIGYQKDTPAAVVFQATNQLRKLQKREAHETDTWYRLQSAGILQEDSLDELFETGQDSAMWTEMVLKLSQYLLLQTAADDALIRLKRSELSEEEIEYLMLIYYKHQHHRSISEFLQHECSHNREMFMQVTTHSPLMTQEELRTISESISMDFAHFDLHEFDTELDFSNKIGPKFLREDSEAGPFLVIIQCDSGHLNYDLIACARYRICDEAIRAKNKNTIRGRQDVTHILFVIRLPQQEVKSQFVGFQGDPWISVHIDDLRPTSEATVIPDQALTASISEMFIGKFDVKPEDGFMEEIMPETFPNSTEESNPEDSGDNMSLSTEQEGQNLSDTDSYKSSEMEVGDKDTDSIGSPYVSEDEDNPMSYKDSIEIPSMEESSKMDLQEDIETTVTAPEQLLDVLRPSIESMQTDEVESDRSVTHSEDDLTVPSLPTLTVTLVPPPHPVDSILSITDESQLTHQPTLDAVSESSDIQAHKPDDNSTEQNNEDPSLFKIRAEEVSETSVRCKSLYPQHHRLLGCVQAAVSILKDSEKDRAMERIQKLIALVPRELPDHLDEVPFYALLVKYIHAALKQREKLRVDEKDWVLLEAMSGRKLQNGGTFRNVLARRIDEVIIPYFAEIIAHIDQNCNLDLFDPKNQATPLGQFWLVMFKLTGGKIDFSSLAIGKTVIKTDFHCKLPFSWFVKETVDAQRANLGPGASQQLRYSLNSICEALSQTELGEALDGVAEDDVKCFYESYLHDFVRYVHKSSHKNKEGNMEYTLIMDALDAMTRNTELCSVDGHESLSHKIVALHLVYSQCHSEVLQFGQLVLHRPGIVQALSRMDQSIRAGLEYTLHLCAVQRVLESDQEDEASTQNLAGLNPPLKKNQPAQNLRHWLNHVRLSQNVIDTVLRSSSGNELAIKSRLTWQRIRALQMFAEKVFLPFSKVDRMVFIIRRLEIALKKNSDFLKKETLEGVKQILNNMFTKTVIVNDTMKRKIKLKCYRFFIEVVSSLCFGGTEAPEPDLIRLLLDTVLQETQTSELTPYKDEEPDETPTIRSFLLQLLLEHKPQQVREYLNDYFERSRLIVEGRNMDQELCLLCIQCLEDALRKRVDTLSVDHQTREITQLLENGYTALQQSSRADHVSLQYLEAVAGVRFGFSAVAEQLKNGRVNADLLQVTRAMCRDMTVNVVDPAGKADTTGPVVYLIKLLVRQFGFPCLKAVNEIHPWVVPEDLRRGDDEEKTIDPFVMYGKNYMDMRNAVNSAMFAKETDELTAHVTGERDVSLVATALYQQATLSRASRAPAKQIQNEAMQILNEFIQGCSVLSPEMMHILRLLLANQQGGNLAQMTVSPHQPTQCRTLSAIVVHTAAVVLCRQNVDLLLPFVNMFNNPSVLVDAYLPTMQEDMLQEVRMAGGAFYQCPNGHPYLVGECGRPVEEKVCRECGARIGGRNHQLLTTNTTARTNDTTKTGYDLGDPRRRSTNPERERYLSAPAVCIVRAIMHSAFIWASCNNHHDVVDIAKVAKGQVLPQALPEFFWMHLEQDMECLRRATSRGIDECAMIVHLVLQQMLETSPPTSPTTNNAAHLHSKQARKEWERLFNGSYIDPVFQNLDASIREALDLVANDDQQEHDQLFYLAYERVKVDETRLDSHLWTFRSQITLEQLKNKVQAGSSVKILDAFLQAEPSLRATQYLPDIVKLQQFLFDNYDRRLEKSRAETMTIRDFLKEIRETRNENTKNECQVMIDSLKQAWALVGQRLKHHSRLPVEEQYLLPAITSDTKLLYLIPTTMREGKCTTALVDFLVLTHNDFIEKCRGIVSSDSSAAAVWREHKVPITHIHQCHLLEYEQQLQSIILSHCHYSLTVGKGQDIKYDLPALEKHILNRFIYGKPTILLDIPNVAYRKDIYTAETFSAIRQKVQPQERIPQRVQQDIVTELRTPDRLRESLDVVDIVLGLLSSGGGNPNVKLKRYINSRKMGRKSFSVKAKEHCTLGHVISLWETLSVQLARQLWQTGQEPFESIPDGYSRGLSRNEDGVDQLKELDKCLRTFDLSLLLGCLFEFIEVHVKHVTANEKDMELVEAMELYWDITGQEPLSDLSRFTKEFPKSVTVDQAVAAWKHIVDYQVKRD